MSKAKYPNRDALRKANDIYLDAMRPFIVRQLKKVQGETVEDLITGSLDDRQADDFWRKLDEDDDIESAIDFSHFPLIIHAQWEDAFGQRFKWDMTVRNMLWLIKDGRNSCEHRGRKDLDAEFTRMHLFLIAELLGKINKPNEKHEVAAIRDELFSDDTAERLAEAEVRLKDVEAENAEHKKSLTKVEKQLKAAESEKTKSKEQGVKLSKQVDEKDEHLKEISKQLADAESKGDAYKKQRASTLKQLEEVKATHATYEADLKTKSNQLEDAIGEWMTSVDRLVTTRKLFATATIGSQEVQAIFPLFENNSAVRILDRRKTDKQNYLLNLLEQKQPTIIYVQSEEMINKLLALVGPEKAAVIGKYDERTSEAEETEILEKLENGELIAVVSNTTFSMLPPSPCLEHFVFCHLVPGLDAFFERCQPAFTSQKHTYLHLIYDSEQDINGLVQKYPDREVLEKLYPELRKLAGTNGNFIKAENLHNELDIAKLSIETGLAIFEELQLLERNGENIKLLPPTGKKLDESEIYRRGEELKKETADFGDFQFEHSIEQIWEKLLKELSVDGEQILRESNIRKISSGVSGIKGDVQSSKRMEQDSSDPTTDNAEVQETSTPSNVLRQCAAEVVDDPDSTLIKESDSEFHTPYGVTENTVDSPSTAQSELSTEAVESENTADTETVETGPTPKPARANAKVTQEQVREIRARREAGESYSKLSKEFGLTPTGIRNIALRNTWKHVE